MKKILGLVLCMSMSACATNRTLYVNENGQTVYQADCGGIWTTIDMGDCLQKAGTTCPMGFNILMAKDEASGMTSGTQVYGDINDNTQGNLFNNNLFINSRTSFNASRLAGGRLSYTRYLIYTCKM